MNRKIGDKCIVQNKHGMIMNIDGSKYHIKEENQIYQILFSDGDDGWYSHDFFDTLKEMRIKKLERIIDEN